MPKKFSELSKRQRNRRTLFYYNSDCEVASQSVSYPNVDDNPIDDVSSASIFELKEPLIEDGNDLQHTSSENLNISHNDNTNSISSETNIINDEFQINSQPQENMHLPLINELCKWTNEFQINQIALTSLLQVLSRHGHNDLPRDARTLLNTPRPGTHDIKTLSKGQYVYYGLLKALTSIDNRFPHVFNHRNVIHLDLNIDGLPISKSSKSQDHQEWHNEHLSDMQENQPLMRNHNNCCGECRNYIHKELKRLSRQMYAIETLLKEGNAGRDREDEVVAEDLLPPLPLMTFQQFLQCENQLKVDTYMRKQFEHMICRIGGSTGKQFIRNTLSKIISNEVGAKITWTGQKSGVGFKSTSISKLIIGNIYSIILSYPTFL